MTLLEEIENLTWYDAINKLKSILKKFISIFIVDAPINGNIYVRKDGNWIEQTSDSGDSRLYKVYTALLNQSGLNAPTAIILGNNTLGEITFSTVDGIANRIISNGLFTENKTYIYLGNSNDSGFVPQYARQDNNIINFIVSTSTDAMNNTPIEIRIYN